MVSGGPGPRPVGLASAGADGLEAEKETERGWPQGHQLLSGLHFYHSLLLRTPNSWDVD